MPRVLPSNVPERMLIRSASSLGSDDLGLARPAAVEIWLDVGFVQLQLRRAAVEHDTNSAAVGLAPGGDLKQVAKGVWHGPIVRENAPSGKSPKNELAGG